ncbi:hypothetical protein ACLI1A_02000 [Flavobacterium sp. RHBU_3]|uniref:hypothetical protein n=1 Tax=Flavobacterium sp. RHBU_3 TaxID=3391184 RepID=UPI00398511FD
MKRVLSITLLALLTLYSCAKKETTAPVAVYSPSGDTTATIMDTLRVQEEFPPEPEKIFERDTVIIKSKHETLNKTELYDAEGRLGNVMLKYVIKTQPESSYRYLLGYEKTSGKKALTILLQENEITAYALRYDKEEEFHSMVVHTFEPMKITFEGIDEVINLGFGFPACGYGTTGLFFMRQGKTLIKGLSTFSIAEVGTDYDDYEIIPPTDASENEIWIKHTTGYLSDDDEPDKEYTNETKRYIWKNGKIVLKP